MLKALRFSLGLGHTHTNISAHLVTIWCHPIELWGGVSVCPALQRNWLPCADVYGRGEGVRNDVRQAAVGTASAPSNRHHLPQLLTDQVRRGGADGNGGIQQLEV